MGLGRGRGHVRAWTAVPGVEIAYLCDVDTKREAEAARLLQRGGQERPAKFVTDFRAILEDPQVDVLSIAAPNHWHAPATILACEAGKHVYVEKPGSHNPREGEWMVQAARKHGRNVQMGNQRRSYPAVREAMQKLHEGVIGKVRFGRAYYFNQRPGIGGGKPVPVPPNLDYDLWLGPAPEVPYKDNLVHYNWHWHWHFGGGELANNGVHSLDLVRWGLQASVPDRVTYLGNRYHYEDDQETPDTGVAQFDFGDRGATWEHSSCHRRRPEDPPFVSFAGESGFVSMTSRGYTIYDLQGKEMESNRGSSSDVPHFENLADAIRDDVSLNSEIAVGQASTLWCHLGNIAYRTNQVLEPEKESGKPLEHGPAMDLWERDYRDGWKPKG